MKPIKQLYTFGIGIRGEVISSKAFSGDGAQLRRVEVQVTVEDEA